MAAATIRLGKISSINYTAGKARVVYEDRDDSVTSELHSSPCSTTYQR